MDTSSSINKNVVNVLWRIVFFIAYYIVLICCGIGLIYLAASITMLLADNLDSVGSINIRLLIIVLLCMLVMWGVVGLFAIYLIKPLFSFTKNNNASRVEIKEADAPLLFQCINELATKIGCKQPKHVYLTTDVNACVFYNTSFWSIFFPVRKNLEIGLGLFQATDIEEVRAVIGHEFGHFAQNSMKVGSTVYVVNSILHNLVYERDFFEKWIDKLVKSNTSGWIRAWGSLTRSLTNIVKRLNIRVFKLVQKAYMRLSRQMEYDADNVACSAVGKEAFISALCKIEVTAQFHDVYEQFLQHLMGQGKTIENYWKGYDIVKQLIAKDYLFSFGADKLLEEPISFTNQKSRITFENAWDSHPELSQRLANARLSKTHSKTLGSHSWNLIPKNLLSTMSSHQLNLLAGTCEANLTVISDMDFKEWVMREIDLYFIPLRLKPFFNRNILDFDIPSDEEMAKPAINPFSDENAESLSEYEIGVQDWNLLNAIVKKEVETSRFVYCGIEHSGKNAPMKEHQEYLKVLHEDAMAIDCEIYKYVVQQSDDADRVKYTYHCVFISNYMMPVFQRFAEQRANMVGKWNSYGGRNADDFERLYSQVREWTEALQHFVNENVNWNLLSSFVNEEDLQSMKSFAGVHVHTISHSAELANGYLQALDLFGDVYQHIGRFGKNLIVQEAKKVMAKQS